MFAGSSTGGNWLVFYLASSSGSNIGWYVSLIGVRRRLDIWEGVSMSSDISSSITSGWGTISSADTVSSGVGGLLRLNSGDTENNDSGDILIRTCNSSSGAEISVMLAVDSGDSP